MSDEGRGRRVVVYCTRCDAIYPGLAWPDGDVRLIGRETCPCGSRELGVYHAADSLRE